MFNFFMNAICSIFVLLLVFNEMDNFLKIRELNNQIKAVQYNLETIISTRGNHYA